MPPAAPLKFSPMLAEALPPLFTLLGVLLLAVVGISLLLIKFRQSLLAGYFLCGVLIANSGLVTVLGGAEAQGSVGRMAEFGVMLLMFTLGLEFSLNELRFLRRMALRGGGWQMGLGLLLGTGAGMLMGLGWAQALVMGTALALSSTAVSLKMFGDLELSGSAGSRFALGIAIFQDLFVIGFFVFLPLLLSVGGAADGVWWQVLLVCAQGAAFVGISVVLARWVIPKVLHLVTKSRNDELFSLTVIGLCVGLAMLGGLLHLSVALGAFVAGLAVSGTIYKHRILSDILPLKHLFLTLFFISTGLLVNVPVVLQHLPMVLGITAALLLGKCLIITWIGLRLGLASRDSVMAAATLASGGEFSLLLLQQADRLQAWPSDLQQILLGSIALSMSLVPFIVKLVPLITRGLGKMGRSHAISGTPDASALHKTKSLTGHAINCGYGPVGQRLLETIQRAGVPALVIDLNPDTVRRLHKHGQPVLFADASHRETWELARLSHARLVAFTFPDASVVATALSIVRQMQPEIPLFARARFASDIARLQLLGVNDVVHDEFESARAFEKMVLRLCDLPAATDPPDSPAEK